MQQIFTFSSVPKSTAELQSLPEASLDSPYKAAALALLVLCNYENDPAATFEMLDFLNGPDPVSAYTKQFIRDRLAGKGYKAKSFFQGATQANGYVPSSPLTVTVSDSVNSFSEANWATVYVKSAGADSPRPIRLRQKPSTGQWFVNEIQCLADIRTPSAADPWA